MRACVRACVRVRAEQALRPWGLPPHALGELQQD